MHKNTKISRSVLLLFFVGALESFGLLAPIKLVNKWLRSLRLPQSH
ncbi:MAG: hypothetical protein ACI8WB_000480 [Phenylobacterium sp.]|jgi:hypothetical protein